jgi:CDP-diacylglycerol--glycerol-3-phosphate 3-phosphatidyltransferase
MAQPPVDPGAPREKPRLTFRRLSGLDRSGPLPEQTRRGAPLNPWTIPNAIGYVRLALIPVFLVLVLRTDDGTSGAAAVVFAVIAWSDYLDGIAARVTGQYSRLGTLLDPLVDRVLVISGVAVCWHYDLLPRWALAVLAARELFMLGLVRWGLRHDIDIKVNWFGRWGVWPAMSAPFFAIAGAQEVGKWFLYVGLVLTIAATALYVQDGMRQYRARKKLST